MKRRGEDKKGEERKGEEAVEKRGKGKEGTRRLTYLTAYYLQKKHALTNVVHAGELLPFLLKYFINTINRRKEIRFLQSSKQ